tara:strand:+ start:305 stop:793 length:489 start_codon:yes stop_codon:yes gene_type:complete
MSDNLQELDFDVSYDLIFGRDQVDLIDIYEPKNQKEELTSTPDKFVEFSSNLVKCFKSKIKSHPQRLRVDSLIEVYRNGEESYANQEDCSLSLWCMASVNMFLEIAGGSSFNTTPSKIQIEKSKEDLKTFNLNLDFKNVNQLYLETRREAMANSKFVSWIEI